MSCACNYVAACLHSKVSSLIVVGLADCTGGLHYSLWFCTCWELSAHLVSTRKQAGSLGRPGKHSGRNALRTRLSQLGFELPPEQLDEVFKRFKVRALSPVSRAIMA